MENKNTSPLKGKKVTFRPELVESDTILSVRHLKQYFVFGHGKNSFKTKAVHDISFDVKKGECFGLVGESGCGKTTTGRSLIRLYDITSGSIFFKGYRISAGKRWNVKEIKFTKIRARNSINALRAEEKEKIAAISDITGMYQDILNVNNLITIKKEEIKAADAKHKLRIASINNNTDDENEQLELIDKENNEFAAKRTRLSADLGELNKRKTELLNEKQLKAKDAPKLSDEDKAKITAIKAEYQAKINDINAHAKEVLKEQKAVIKQIKYDNAHVDKKLMSKMQMIFQDPVDSLDPRMTVEDIIQEGLQIQGYHNKYANSKKVADILEKVGLVPEHASRYPHEFSGGQRQRIGIARALIMNPEFLICDEPISALDVSIRAQIINLLNSLKEEMGLTMLFIAHDLSVVKYFCDRIAVMYYGKIVELATSDELFKHPLHPYTNALLSAIPKPDPALEKSRQRIVYNPSKDHDYSKEKPTLTEIIPGHWVLANGDELNKYKEKIASIDKQ